ncbi:TPA: hypothetical protein JD121_09175 [Clostridioides difficile]|nr:hypothetical protein [Clostridioides difficile]
MLLENGASIKDIQHILHHTKISTTMDTYSHITNFILLSQISSFYRNFLYRHTFHNKIYLLILFHYFVIDA